MMTPIPSATARGRTPQSRHGVWAIIAGLIAMLALSSVAPFVTLGDGVPSLSRPDVATATLFIATWIPFGLLVWVIAGRGGLALHRRWPVHLLLACTIPAAHTQAFIALQRDASGGIAFLVLTLIGTLQYFITLSIIGGIEAKLSGERSAREATELDLDRARLSSELARARLAALNAQLHPHFLFNTLNSVSALVEANPAGARAMINKLSELLRAVLVDAEAVTVPLSRELQLLDAYVGIQRVRFGDRLHVDVEVDGDAATFPVPPLLLQPLVENAIEHAIAAHETGGRVTIAARISSGRLCVTVADDGYSETYSTPAKQEGGIGHRNTRDRLTAIYGRDHAFTFDARDDGGHVVAIEIPRERALAAENAA